VLVGTQHTMKRQTSDWMYVIVPCLGTVHGRCTLAQPDIGVHMPRGGQRPSPHHYRPAAVRPKGRKRTSTTATMARLATLFAVAALLVIGGPPLSRHKGLLFAWPRELFASECTTVLCLFLRCTDIARHAWPWQCQCPHALLHPWPP